MGDYTDQDRERSQKTLTLLEQNIKLGDERHESVLDALKDHEGRLRKSESFRYKLIGWAVGAGIISVSAGELIKAKIGM